MAPDELLARVAKTLRADIGPAVSEPFAKTQAFMASVVLEKLSGELRTAAGNAAADATDAMTLVADLDALVAGDALPNPVAEAIGRVRAGEGATALSALVAALWAERASLGAARFDAMLGRVRQTLRARVDRQLSFAA